MIHSQTRPWRGTFGDVLDLSRRAASGLVDSGVRPGDVVTFQTPNWLEGAVTFYAAAFVGAVVAPIVHIYGTRETSYILDACQPKVHVTAARFGHQDFLANLESMPDVPGMQLIVLDQAGPAGSVGFDELLAADPIAAPVQRRPRQPRPRGVDLGHDGEPEGRGPLASDGVCGDRAAWCDLATDRALLARWPIRSATPSGCWVRS